MTSLIPLTSEVREAYASTEDSTYGLGYEDRALNFDAWLNATIAEAKTQARAEAVAELSSHIKTRLDREASVKLDGVGRSHLAVRENAFTAANFIVTTSAKEILED